MTWKGITDNQTDIGNSQSDIENASFFVQGELLRRPGFGARIAQGGILVSEQGSYLLYITSGGAIVANDGTTSTTLLTGYNVVKYPCMQQALGRMYFVNDFDAVKVSDDGMTIRDAGVIAPTVALTAPSTSGGSVDIGSHFLRYRWYDSRRQRYSDPSDAITVTVASTAKTLTVTRIVSGDSTIDTIIFEMSPVGDGTYYQAATAVNTAGTTAISISDGNLVNRTPASLYGDFGHVPPPLSSIICEHQSYMFFWGASIRTFSSITVTNGSPTVSGTGFSTQWAGRQVVVTGYTTTYYVSSATTTTITLTANFVGTTSAAATITVTSGTPELLGWSQPGQPESTDATALARKILMKAGDRPAAMLSLHGDLYLIGQRSMRRLNFQDDPSNAQIINVPSTLGAFHQRCVVTDAGNLAFGWGRDGMWVIDAMLPKRISDAIQETIDALIDASRLEERFVVWEPDERVALFFFCLSGQTACKVAAAFYPDAGSWQLWKYRQAMTCGTTNNYTDRARLLLVDSNNSSWRVGTNINDGIDNGLILAGAASTTTVVNGSFGATVGQVIYRPATAEERYVTVSSAGSLTVGVAFATAPTPGETLYLGSIRQRILTDWGIGDGMNLKKRPRYLLLSVRAVPAQTFGTVSVYLYKDFNENAVGVTSSQADQWPYGVTPINGTTEIRVNLDIGLQDGFVAVPVFADWARAIRAEIIAEQPLNVIRWLDVSWSINGKPEQAEVEQE